MKIWKNVTKSFYATKNNFFVEIWKKIDSPEGPAHKTKKEANVLEPELCFESSLLKKFAKTFYKSQKLIL